MASLNKDEQNFNGAHGQHVEAKTHKKKLNLPILLKAFVQSQATVIDWKYICLEHTWNLCSVVLNIDSSA